MPQFRRKPTTVEAVQFMPCGEHKNEPPKGVEVVLNGHADNLCYSSVQFFVTTIHGDRIEVFGGDWIVTEPDGEHYYPVKPEIFAATYETENPTREHRLLHMKAMNIVNQILDVVHEDADSIDGSNFVDWRQEHNDLLTDFTRGILREVYLRAKRDKATGNWLCEEDWNEALDAVWNAPESMRIHLIKRYNDGERTLEVFEEMMTYTEST